MRTGYSDVPPPAALVEFIDAFWVFRTPTGEGRAEVPPTHRVLPDGCIDLIFGFRSGPGAGLTEPRLLVFGPTTRFTLVPIEPGFQFIGVRFKPGRAGPILGVCPPALADRELAADDGPNGLVRLLDRLAACRSAPEAESQFREAVLALVAAQPRRRCPRTHRALALLQEARGCLRVEEVARAVGVTERTLHRDVLGVAGLSPKSLARILRFRAALALLQARPGGPLSGLALEGGYADQAHMTREFRDLSGLAPSAFRKQPVGG